MDFGFRVIRSFVLSCVLLILYWWLFADTRPDWVPSLLAERYESAFFGLVGWCLFWGAIFFIPSKAERVFDLDIEKSLTEKYGDAALLGSWVGALVLVVVVFWSGYSYAWGAFVTIGDTFPKDGDIASSAALRKHVLNSILYFVRNLGIPVILFAAPLVWTYKKALLTEHPRFLELFLIGRGGSARWAGLGAYNKNHFWFPDCVMTYSNGIEYQGAVNKRIYLGKTLFQDTFIPQHAGIFDDAHMLTIGATGSGKSTTALWPNLITYEGSAFVIDPKGEHARRTMGRRQSWVGWDEGEWAHDAVQDGLISSTKGTDTRKITKTTRQVGSHCWLLDPFREVSQYPSAAYNPLSEITIEDDNARGLISAISDGCVMPEGETNAHFYESAKTILEGIIAHVMSRHAKEEQNLPFIYDLLLGMRDSLELDQQFIQKEPKPPGFFEKLKRKLDISDPNLLDELLIEMRTNGAAGGLPQLAANVLDRAGDRERGSIMTTVFRSIKWVSDPAMRKALQDGPFTFKKSFNRWKCSTVYIVLPERFMKEQARWMRTLINLSIAVIQQSKHREEIPTLYVLDEFPRMGGALKMIEEGVVTLRSAGIKLWPIIQNIGQLKRDYGRNWETFVSSSNVQLFGVNDTDTARWASERIGQALRKETKGMIRKRTVSKETIKLMTPDEIMSYCGKDSNRGIVIPVTGYPMRLERMAYKPLPGFKGLRQLKGHYDNF